MAKRDRTVTIWDADGKPVKVNDLNAHDLVNNAKLGFTWKPAGVEAPEETTTEGAAPAAPEVDEDEAMFEEIAREKAAKEAAAASSEATTRVTPSAPVVDFETMDKEALVEWAKTNLPHVEIDGRKSKGSILGLIHTAIG